MENSKGKTQSCVRLQSASLRTRSITFWLVARKKSGSMASWWRPLLARCPPRPHSVEELPRRCLSSKKITRTSQLSSTVEHTRVQIDISSPLLTSQDQTFCIWTSHKWKTTLKGHSKSSLLGNRERWLRRKTLGCSRWPSTRKVLPSTIPISSMWRGEPSKWKEKMGEVSALSPIWVNSAQSPSLTSSGSKSWRMFKSTYQILRASCKNIWKPNNSKSQSSKQRVISSLLTAWMALAKNLIEPRRPRPRSSNYRLQPVHWHHQFNMVRRIWWSILIFTEHITCFR